MKKLIVLCALLAGDLYGQASSQTYRFTTDYTILDVRGRVGHRERIVGTYTRDFSNDKVGWTAVDVSRTSTKSPDQFGEPERREFMEGFSYSLHGGDMTSAEFFRGLPPGAVQERNLVWDTRMFEAFGEAQWDSLKPGVPYVFKGQNIPLAGAGTFENNDVHLVLSGTTTCGIEECGVVDYQAFFNTFELLMPMQTLTGRSHYWGQIWVSLATKRVVRASLYEDVLGELKLQGSDEPQTVNIFRVGVLDPVEER